MITFRHSSIVALVVFGSFDGALPTRAPAQGTFRVSVQAAKTEFFEGEPVYLLLRVTNTGADTAWVSPPDLASRELIILTTRSDGSAVPELRTWLDYYYPLNWKGVPLPPGGTWHQTAVLQDYFGDDGADVTPIYNRHLRPGTYRVVARYNPSLPAVGAPELDIVESAGLEIAIRPRSGSEDAIYREVAAVRALAWSRGTRGQYARALIELIGRRQAADSGDPFLSFLLNEGVATLPAVGTRIDAGTAQRLQGMRLGAARALRDTPAGALAALSALSARPTDAPLLSSLLGTSLSGEVAREWEARARRRKLN